MSQLYAVPLNYSNLEIQDLNKRYGKDKLEYFYDIWALKESYIKMVGKGLSIPLNSFSCSVVNKQFMFKSRIEQQPVYLKKYHIDPKYKLAVSQHHAYFPEHIHQICLITWLKSLMNGEENYI
ncbi:4'-phosphopantetheinyl transferase superfamily protein [Virgibacillus sp. C22-A2]|uniref:4'-phosphopantetheinyl transferase superfamily protein n=1 Tax=Virgibacillus tibetensis TaxID=3042313 RepID=A0ABU6KE47_9BACI|nr:4'-phosphopantetheinyl transferase superfamily protein [Virgibacillus sp. C22-A2]